MTSQDKQFKNVSKEYGSKSRKEEAGPKRRNAMKIDTHKQTADAQTVKIGTKFRSHYADGNPEWTVTRKSGNLAWIARTGPDELDWPNMEKAFTTNEIQSAMAWKSFFQENAQSHEQFYAALKPRQILHYHDSFGKFVRCKVTPDHKLLPVALVGDWKPYDLPKRMRDGSASYCYHAEKIQKGETFTPNYSNIYEASECLRSRSKVDPRACPEISLELPPMTAEQIEIASWDKLREEIFELASDNAKDPEEVVRAVHQRIKDCKGI